MTQLEMPLVTKNRVWTDEEVRMQFQLEVTQRFAAENAAHLAQERAEIEAMQRDKPEEWAELIAQHPDMAEPRPALRWEVFEQCVFDMTSNHVNVIFPANCGIDLETLAMFDGTSVAWSYAAVTTRELCDGDPRLIVEVTLIDYWDDERAATWTQLASSRKVGHNRLVQRVLDLEREAVELRKEASRLNANATLASERRKNCTGRLVHDEFTPCPACD